MQGYNHHSGKCCGTLQLRREIEPTEQEHVAGSEAYSEYKVACMGISLSNVASSNQTSPASGASASAGHRYAQYAGPTGSFDPVTTPRLNDGHGAIVADQTRQYNEGHTRGRFS